MNLAVYQRLVYTYRQGHRFFVPFINGFNAVCLHIMLNRSKVLLTKTVMLPVRVNKRLSLVYMYFCICIKHQEWVLWQQIMVFTLDVSIIENRRQRSKENSNANVTCKPAFNRNKNIFGGTHLQRLWMTRQNTTVHFLLCESCF